jgi:hypothetical protein
MLGLERATRLRWLGWIILAPCLISVATGLISTIVVPAGPITETIVGTMILILIGGVGGLLLYFGERGTLELHDDLERVAPWVLAGYLRIDKNAAWIVAWISIPLAIFCVLAGVAILAAPTPTVSQNDAWPSIVFGGVLGVGAAYAVMRALQLKRQIAWLAEEPPAPLDRRPTTSW